MKDLSRRRLDAVVLTSSFNLEALRGCRHEATLTLAPSINDSVGMGGGQVRVIEYN